MLKPIALSHSISSELLYLTTKAKFIAQFEEATFWNVPSVDVEIPHATKPPSEVASVAAKMSFDFPPKDANSA